MNIQDILTYCERLAPPDTAEEWDNCGLLIGVKDTEVTSVLLALDITADVIKEAKEKGCELIISHHPVIFDPLRSVEPGSAVALLIKNDIAALCLHTNLDRAQSGVNICLARALGLQNTTLYPEEFLCIGEFPHAVSPEELAARIKEKLQAPSVRYTGAAGPLLTVAVSSGGGGEGVALYEKYRFDAFVTGELKHHQYLYAREHNVAAFDAGHFSTEDVVIEPLKRMLQKAFPAASFIKSDACGCPYRAV